MSLLRIFVPALIAATLLVLGGFASQVVRGQEPPVWDLSDHRVPIGQEMGEQLFFDLNRNDFYGDAALTNKVIIITAYSHWQDPASNELVISTLVWTIDHSGDTPVDQRTPIGQVRLSPNRPVVAETEVTMLPDGHATRFYWYEEGRWAFSQTLPEAISEGLSVPQILYIPADGQMLRWQ